MKAKYTLFVLAAIVLFSASSAMLLTKILEALSKSNEQFDPRDTVVYCKSLMNPTIKPTAAVAVVNGVKITRADYDKWVALRTRVYCIVNGLDPSKRSLKVDNYNSRNKSIALSDLVRRELIRQAADREGVVISKRDIKQAQLKFMKDIGKPSLEFSAFCKVLPPLEANELRKQTEEDARGEALLASWATNDLKHVTEKDIDDRLAFADKYNADVHELNKQSFKRAAEAKAEILGGKTFRAVANERADLNKEEGSEWDTFELDEFDTGDDMFKFLSKAKAGDISDPMDMEDGIGIVGVLAVEKDEDDDDAADQYVLVRCLFNAYDDLDEPTDRKALAKLILENRKTEARTAMMTKLVNESKIEFPYGKSLFSKPKQKKPKSQVPSV